MRALLVIAAGVGLTACSTVGGGVGDTLRMTRNGVGDAVTAPFKDLNLVRPKMPVALADAAKDPYRRPERTDCAYLAHEIAQLDLALGPDLDVPRGADKTGLRTRGAVAISDAALSAVRDVTTGWIPFRSVVRRLTGATDRQDDMEDAVHAGGVRRAYLKGLGLQQNCPHPAAPLPAMTVAQGAGDSPPAQPASAHTVATTPDAARAEDAAATLQAAAPSGV
ncbi:MAG TPA: hypothetical protein VF699_04405 [Caulobacteraceae bacterium]|jgi:hypothetical protein